MDIKKVGVLGCGLMGSGIAQTAATAGYETIVREVSDDLIAKGFGGIEKSLAKFAEKGTLKESANQIRDRLRGTTKFEDLSDCDIIIEAIVENLDTKRETYLRLDDLCKPETIFASNTSSLSITQMMSVVSAPRQQRFIGMLLFGDDATLQEVLQVSQPLLNGQLWCWWSLDLCLGNQRLELANNRPEELCVPDHLEDHSHSLECGPRIAPLLGRFIRDREPCVFELLGQTAGGRWPTYIDQPDTIISHLRRQPHDSG